MSNQQSKGVIGGEVNTIKGRKRISRPSRPNSISASDDLDYYLSNPELVNAEIEKAQRSVVGYDDDNDDFAVQQTYGKKQKTVPTKKFDENPNSLVERKVKSYTKREDSDNISIGTIASSLSKNAKARMEFYLKTSPEIKTITEQIKILTIELENYRVNKSIKEAKATQELINLLNGKKQEFIDFQNKAYRKDTQADRARIKEEIRNSPVLIELKNKRKIAEKRYAETNPNSLYWQICEYRKVLNINDKATKIIDIDDVIDIDEYLEIDTKQDNIVRQEYYNLIGIVADLIDMNVNQVLEMPSGTIVRHLHKMVDPDHIEEIKTEIARIKFEASAEMNKIKGNEDITSVIFSIFDFETESEEKPKELLASANVDYVKTLAFTYCRKNNALHYIEDAISYGLLGLTVAINSWYKIQKMADSAISFNGFAYSYVYNNIKKGMFEMTSGGMSSKSALATLDHKNKKYLEQFVQLNPELKDLPEELLTNLMNGLEDAPVVNTEGELVGGEDADFDVFANLVKSDHDENYIEAKLEFENLLKSLKSLFDLFETKVDKEGNIKRTNKKMFDRYDYKLFKLMFHLEMKPVVGTQKNGNGEFIVTHVPYTQTEIGKIMYDYEAQYGKISTKKDTISQEAISARYDTLLKNIKYALDENPDLKIGFEHLYHFTTQNSELMNLMSNKYEGSTGKKIEPEFDEPTDIYGKRLNQLLPDENEDLLDEEISARFSSIFDEDYDY